MRIYTKNLNKTAESIVSSIINGTKGFKISKAAYDWLYMNANSLSSLVEELLSDKLGGYYYVVIDREKRFGEYWMYVDYNEVK